MTVSPSRPPVVPSAFGDVPGRAATAAEGDDDEAEEENDRAAWKKCPVAAAKNGEERILRGDLRLFPFSESSSDGKGLRSRFRVSGPLPSAITTSTTLSVLDGMSGMGFFCWGSMVGELK